MDKISELLDRDFDQEEEKEVIEALARELSSLKSWSDERSWEPASW